jgi:hypothetical protein
VGQIAEVSCTARAVPNKNSRFTGTVVVCSHPKSFFNERVTWTTKDTKMTHIGSTTETDWCHQLMGSGTTTATCAIMHVNSSQKSLAPELRRKATLNQETLRDGFQFLIASFN